MMMRVRKRYAAGRYGCISFLIFLRALTKIVNKYIMVLTGKVNVKEETMNDKFFALTKEKQDAMVNAAMRVFSKYEYKNATTDEIVKEAGISKGLLFHYFGNKKTLYLYTYEYAVKLLIKELKNGYDETETDFFLIFEKAQGIKVKILISHPCLMEFLTRVYVEKENPADEVKVSFQNLVESSMKKILERMDRTKFKDSISADQVVNIVIWMAEGFVKNKRQSEFEDLKQINDEFLQYLNLLKAFFYKEEYL